MPARKKFVPTLLTRFEGWVGSCFLLFLVALATLFAPESAPGDPLPPEDRKAALISKITGYVNDVNGDGVITIGFVGDELIQDKVASRFTGSDKVKVISGASNCDIVWGSADGGTALTIGDGKDFAGILRIVSAEGGKLELYYSRSELEKAAKTGLKVSSRLLRLAEPLP